MSLLQEILRLNRMPGALGLGTGTASPRTKAALESLLKAVSADVRRKEEGMKRAAGETVKRQRTRGGSRRGRSRRRSKARKTRRR